MLDVSRCDKNLITTRPFNASPLFKLRKTDEGSERRLCSSILSIIFPSLIHNVHAFVCYEIPFVKTPPSHFPSRTPLTQVKSNSIPCQMQVIHYSRFYEHGLSIKRQF